jgi:hypothetical protein
LPYALAGHGSLCPAANAALSKTFPAIETVNVDAMTI